MAVDFNKGRSVFLKSFVKNWQQMLVSYKNNFTIMCFSGEKVEQTLFNRLGKENEDAMSLFTILNNDVSYYFGLSIRDIVRYELEWYKKYAKKCPPEKNLKQLIKRLMNRNNKVISIMHKKVFIPDAIYKNYDNLNYDAQEKLSTTLS